MEPKNPENDQESARYCEFLQLFSRHQRSVFGHIYHMLHNHHDTEDVFQRTSMVLWQKFSDFEAGTNFRSWACQIAFYETRNFIRTSSRDRHYFNDELLMLLSDEREAESDILDARREALSQCFEKLKGKDQNLLHEVYDNGEPINEIAARLGSASQTLYNKLNLIRRRLHTCINQKVSEVSA